VLLLKLTLGLEYYLLKLLLLVLKQQISIQATRKLVTFFTFYWKGKFLKKFCATIYKNILFG